MRALPLITLLSAALLTACTAGGAPTPSEEVPQIRVAPSGPTDASGLSVVDATLGERFEGSLAPLPTGTPVTRDTIRGRLDVYRVPVEAGTTIAAVARATDGELDPMVLLRDPSYETVDEGRDQAVLPSARQSDSVVVHTVEQTGTYFVFVAAEYFATGGGYTVDLWSLDVAPPVALSHTNPALRAYAQELRELDPEIDEALAAGWVREGDDGYLARDPEGFPEAPLSERAEITRLIPEVESHRRALFGELLRANGLADTDEDAQRVGRACAALWSALRASSSPSAPSDA